MSRNRDTFTNFLKSKKRDESSAGDFAQDWLNDTDNHRPRGAFGWKAVLSHLERNYACQECIDVAEELWHEWRKTDMPDRSDEDVY